MSRWTAVDTNRAIREHVPGWTANKSIRNVRAVQGGLDLSPKGGGQRDKLAAKEKRLLDKKLKSIRNKNGGRDINGKELEMAEVEVRKNVRHLPALPPLLSRCCGGLGSARQGTNCW